MQTGGFFLERDDMNEQQAVAVRDPRDPFSQALSLLLKEAKNPRELKEKYRKELKELPED